MLCPQTSKIKSSVFILSWWAKRKIRWHGYIVTCGCRKRDILSNGRGLDTHPNSLVTYYRALVESKRRIINCRVVCVCFLSWLLYCFTFAMKPNNLHFVRTLLFIHWLPFWRDDRWVRAKHKGLTIMATLHQEPCVLHLFTCWWQRRVLIQVAHGGCWTVSKIKERNAHKLLIVRDGKDRLSA